MYVPTVSIQHCTGGSRWNKEKEIQSEKRENYLFIVSIKIETKKSKPKQNQP